MLPTSSHCCTHTYARRDPRGFSLLEMMAAIAVLGVVCVSFMTITDRCLEKTSELVMRDRAFEVARELLEQVLCRPSVKESVEMGTSDRYPTIQWEVLIEPFDDPINGSTWVRVVSAAEYQDVNDVKQRLELVHWLTAVSEAQLKAMSQKENSASGEHLASIEEAAQYAGVDPDTIQEWLDKGLVKAEDGSFITHNLDIFRQAGGDPTDEDKAKQIRSPSELSEDQSQAQAPLPVTTDKPDTVPADTQPGGRKGRLP